MKGVAYYAEKVARTLQTNQPELNISDIDVLCVKIAGLCHDLGHGPFSHVFDGVFLSKIRPERHWRHEDGSVMMLKHLIFKNNIKIEEFGLTETDFLFIQEIINGCKEENRKGRESEKFFLYDIVNNRRSGLDVDKLDYFQRDVRYTNASSGNVFNFERFLEFGRVFKASPISSSQQDNPNYMICYPEKLLREAVDLFAVRFRLHQAVYTHKSVKKVELMVMNIFFPIFSPSATFSIVSTI